MAFFETDDAIDERTGVEVEAGAGAEADDLPWAIERQIEQASSGQISGLVVTRLGDAILLQGHCRTYHASQLAHQAALELIEGSVPLIDLISVH